MKKANQILVLLLLLSASCKPQTIERELGKCINKELQESNKIYNIKNIKIDYYRSISKVEKFLIKKSVLEDNDRESYISLFTLLQNNESIYDTIKYYGAFDILQRDGIYFESHFTINAVCLKCPFEIVKNGELDKKSSLYAQANTGDELEIIGIVDPEKVKNLINIIAENGDFVKIEYRAPIIMYILLEMGKPK